MKALSLWQPWAQLIAVGAKRLETRGWNTKVRGPVAIHAALTRNRETERARLSSPFWEALQAGGWSRAHELPRGCVIATCRIDYVVPIPADLDSPGIEAEVFTACTCGHIRDTHHGENHAGVCRCPVRWNYANGGPGIGFDGHTATCACPGYERQFTEYEKAFGIYTPGRFAFVLKDVRVLAKPLAWKGGQRWFDVPDDAIAASGFASAPAPSTGSGEAGGRDDGSRESGHVDQLGGRR